LCYDTFCPSAGQYIFALQHTLSLLQNLAEVSLDLEEKERLTFDLRGPPLANGEEEIGLQPILDQVVLIVYKLQAGHWAMYKGHAHCMSKRGH
jgi:hypothetical protein